ncbi:MAG: hypothetical protein ACLQVJ_03005 [Syntrophobacteraceae bacterium]
MRNFSKHIISAAILLLISFWFTNSLAVQYFPDKLNMPASAKRDLISAYSELLESMKEPPIWPKAKDQKAISYRLTFRIAKGGPRVVLRLDRIAKTKWVLTVKQVDYDYSSDKLEFRVNRKQRLTGDEVSQFKELFAQLQFWELPTVGALEAEEMFDGTNWLLEAVENGRYHLMRRHAPNSDYWPSSRWDAEGFQQVREREGYPYIDRATSVRVNKRLVALGEFLVKLSGLKLRYIN